jgi:hypothetical protein
VKSGIIPVVILIGGYLAFEAHLMHKAAYRLEPLYLYDQFVIAGEAVARCGDPPAAELDQFIRNLQATERRTLAALRESRPDTPDDALAAELAERRAGREAETAAEIERLGCDAPETRAMLKRYEIRAARRLG